MCKDGGHHQNPPEPHLLTSATLSLDHAYISLARPTLIITHSLSLLSDVCYSALTSARVWPEGGTGVERGGDVMELVVTLALRLSCVRSSGKTTPAALYSPINVEMQLKKQVLQKPVISSPLSHVDVSNYISFASWLLSALR